MSDYIYSSKPMPKGFLKSCIASIYIKNRPEIREYHGQWGALAVSQTLYNGFQEYETDSAICVVLGGPVLYFTNNAFLTGKSPAAGAKAIYDRFASDQMNWKDDLSSPFTALIINKKNGRLTCVTDLMLYIPLYRHRSHGRLFLGTHVDALAKASDQVGKVDKVSFADFALNGAVTHPHTMYENIEQARPATVYTIDHEKEHAGAYWAPEDTNRYANVDEAAEDARARLEEHLRRATSGMRHIAQFLSGGEDSRLLAGLLPEDKLDQAYILVESHNHEEKIARQVAEAYGLDLKTIVRPDMHYLDAMPGAARIVGSGRQFTGCHYYDAIDRSELRQYDGVFGGFLADVFLKAFVSRTKHSEVNARVLKNEAQIEVPSFQGMARYIRKEVVQAVVDRRRKHYHALNRCRDDGASEWFQMWPFTIRPSSSFYGANRRLYRTYEPYMCNGVVQVAAAVPIAWKREKKLFRAMAMDVLRQTRHIPHANGTYPGKSRRYNAILEQIKRPLLKYHQWIRRWTGVELIYNAGWTDFYRLTQTPRFHKMVAASVRDMPEVFPGRVMDLFHDRKIRYQHKFNVLQSFMMMDMVG